MSKPKRFRPLDGVLCLDKDVGLSSNDALYRARRRFRAAKAGHGGTLDPFASGVLPILFGEATKFSRWFLDGSKHYEVRLRFGQETDTQDGTGQVTREALPPSQPDWESALQAFQGPLEQRPPAYSALKIQGQRAYDLARRGETVDLAPRRVEIYALQLLEADAQEALLRVHCSKGTYIRTLVQDLGRYLGSAAHAIALRRTAAADLTLAQAHSLAELESLDEEALLACLIPLESCLTHLPRWTVPAREFHFLRHGNDVRSPLNLKENEELMLLHQGRFFGVGQQRGGRIFPQRLIAHPEQPT